MHYRLLIGGLSCVLITCCNKSRDSTPNITGQWELVSTDGAFTGHQEFAAGNGNTFTFDGNRYVRQITLPDTAYQLSGTFRIYAGKACEEAQQENLLDFDQQASPSTVSITDGKLSIGTPGACIADGGSSLYRKISN